MCLCLSILTLESCVPAVTMVADSGSAAAMRNGKEIRDWPVFVPSPDKKSWTPVRATIPKGAWIFTDHQSIKK